MDARGEERCRERVVRSNGEQRRRKHDGSTTRIRASLSGEPGVTGGGGKSLGLARVDSLHWVQSSGYLESGREFQPDVSCRSAPCVGKSRAPTSESNGRASMRRWQLRIERATCPGGVESTPKPTVSQQLAALYVPICCGEAGSQPGPDRKRFALH
ncbi:hypothetical protein TCAP_04467 [Tolypocladium capitatum]|uniref:Uncharacterized protein n=1 Tax=Tolypocladium capitatum TaxID=45235 RepID=A0A2K3QDG0_9HYPO|nr:hypothetical protein TCAP_04467 [Tolypocladium capitatum]